MNIKTCVLAIQRYESDINDWCNHYVNLGFDKIYVLDNNNIGDELKSDNPNMVIIPFNGVSFKGSGYDRDAAQKTGYNYGLEYIKMLDYTYCLIVDIDEYLDFKGNYTNIQDFIQKEMIDNPRDMIQIQWETYDDNNIIYESEISSIFESYTHKMKFQNNEYNAYINNGLHKWCKTIFRIFEDTEVWLHYPIQSLMNINYYHNFILDKTYATINHYRYKCIETYMKKIAFRHMLNTNGHNNDKLGALLFFKYNKITRPKLDAFKLLAQKYKLEYDQEIFNDLYENLFIKSKYLKNLSTEYNDDDKVELTEKDIT